MKKLIYTAFLMLIYNVSFTQVVTLLNKENNEPIEMARFMSHNPKKFGITNSKGQLDLSDFENSEKIEIRAHGFKSLQLSYAEIKQNQFVVLMTASSINMDEVVVSATRWDQTSRNLPSKITTISSKDVALQNPQTAADLLANSGEVFVQKSQQGGGSPMIRGFSTNRLLYSVDGVRMNTAIFRSGNIQNVISLDPFAIENTEVLFGPGSVIYGSDAVGGVMSFQTLTPQFSYTAKPLIAGKVVSRVSSANQELTNHADLNVGWKKWASVTSITHAKFGNLKMGTKGPDEYLKLYYVQRVDSVDKVFENENPLIQNPTEYSQINMMQKIRFSPNKKWDIQYGFHFSETSSYSRYDRLIETQPNGLPSSVVWNYGPQKWMMNNLSVTHSHKNKLYDRMTLRLAQQYFEESRIDRRFNHHRLRTQLEEVQAYSINLDFEKEKDKHRFYYGLEYVQNDVKSLASAVNIKTGAPMQVADRYPASTWRSSAAYLNYRFLLSEKWMIQAGGRFSLFSVESDFSRLLEFFPFDFATTSIQNTATTGSLGVVYIPTKTWKVSVNASTGFRAPNVDDMGKLFDFAAGDVVVPNTNLKAEYAYNAEMNVAKIFGDFLKLDVTGFYTYLDNAMVRRAFQVNGQDSMLYNGNMSKTFAIQNAAYATVYGVNVGIEIKLPAGFGLSSRYNYQLGNEEMDNGTISRSRHAAPAFGVSRLTYQKEKLTMQIYATYSAGVSHENLNEEERQKPFIYAKDENDNPYSPSWYTLNFKAMYQFHSNLSFSAGLENITDQRYRPYSSGLVAAGRNFILSLKTNF
jgi:hemoglobin/transferrin/lactoferrin receptor protein